MIAPKLRFSEFKDEWIELSLKEYYSKIRNGFVGIATPFYVENGIKYLQGKNIKDGKIDPKGLIYISEDFHHKKNNSQLKQNDILMVQSGHVGECAVVTQDYENANCHALIILSPDHNEKVNSHFVVYYFYSHYGKKRISEIKTGNTIEHVLASEIKEVTLNFPTPKEQTKIAEFLSAVDDKISQLSRQLELLNQYKKGVMQKIFSQEIRFKNDNGEDFGEWDYLQLDEVLDYEQPTKYIVESTEYDNIFQTPVLTAGKSFILGYTNETNGIFEAKKENVIIFDDFTTAYKFVDFDFKVKSSAMKILKVKNENFDIRYIYATFSLLQLPLGDEHKRRWISEYSLQEIPVPTIQEQKKIAEFLTAIDERIDHTTAQLTQTKQWKKGLLQQMFV